LPLFTLNIVARVKTVAELRPSHAGVVGNTAAFGRDPDDVLRRVRDVAGLAVHAVLRVDLQAVGVVFVLQEAFNAKHPQPPYCG
jgi:hypothetical protein